MHITQRPDRHPITTPTLILLDERLASAPPALCVSPVTCVALLDINLPLDEDSTLLEVDVLRISPVVGFTELVEEADVTEGD